MNPVSVDVKDILVDDLIGYFLGDNPRNPLSLPYGIVIGAEVDSPRKLITIYDISGGIVTQTTDLTTIPYEAFQVMVRSQGYTDGYDKIKEIETTLNALGKYTPPDSATTYTYQGWYQKGSIMSMGKDERNNWGFSVNYDTFRIA